jgi:hypothetical protein
MNADELRWKMKKGRAVLDRQHFFERECFPVFPIAFIGPHRRSSVANGILFLGGVGL